MIKEQCTGFLNTPPIWEKKQFDIQQFDFPEVSLQSFQSKAIPVNIRLGQQMEYVFKQLVKHSGTYDVVVYNLPIKQEKRTLGEIDFILKERNTDQLIHVELTYKFYLIDTGIKDPIHSLIGPNRRDFFFTKMEKIKNFQFSLLHSDEGIAALSKLGVSPLKMEHQCCFKAQLFQPFGSGEVVDLGPLNRACLAGYWLRFSDFNTVEFTDAIFYMPTKSEWVIEPINKVEWKSHDEIMVDIHQSLLTERSPLLWSKNPEGEFKKFFIVWW